MNRMQATQMIKLTLREQPTVPLEAETIVPNVFATLSNEQIRASLVYHGKRQCRLDDFFDVDGEFSDSVTMTGDLHRVKLIGKGMSHGTLTIYGSVGMHLGAQMKGGTIEVSGDASDWIGAEMTGGFIRVRGNGGARLEPPTADRCRA